MDKIRILNLKIPGRHGVYDFEKDHNQIFELDVEMHMQLSGAGESDNLEDTVNYDDAVALITTVFSTKCYSLLEALGEAICSKLLSEYPIEKVIIKIRKPNAPIIEKLDTVEVELVRPV